MSKEHVDLEGFIKGVERRNPGQPEFVQAVHEAAHDIFDFIQGKPAYHEYQILRRIAEPVSDPTAPEIRRLVADLFETMVDADGA